MFWLSLLSISQANTQCDFPFNCSENYSCEDGKCVKIQMTNPNKLPTTPLTKDQLHAPCKAKNVLFSCELENNKKVEVCDMGQIRYTFGKTSKPEIILAVKREDIQFSCWPRLGDRGSSLSIPNGNTTYTVSSYWNMNHHADSEEYPGDKGVSVTINGKHAASIACKEFSIVSWEHIPNQFAMRIKAHLTLISKPVNPNFFPLTLITSWG
jgi:hypothetical protein